VVERQFKQDPQRFALRFGATEKDQESTWRSLNNE
jgi:hypothetical protein